MDVTISRKSCEAAEANVAANMKQNMCVQHLDVFRR
jgi:hypothetical protein